jgi:hypothetical protein
MGYAVNLDDKLVEQAIRYTQISDLNELLNLALAKLVGQKLPVNIPDKKVLLADLDTLFARLPKLDEADSLAFEQDIADARQQLVLRDPSWD